LQDLGDERRVLDLVSEPIGVERVGQQSVVVDEVLYGRYAADIGLVIGGCGFHRGLGGGHRLIPAQVTTGLLSPGNVGK
jgi:hypothetical protein